MKSPMKPSLSKQNLFSATFMLIIMVVFLFSAVGCKANYGTKLTFSTTNEVYYTDKVTSKEAQALGEYLLEVGIFADDGNSRAVQLNKSGSTYEFRMIVKTGLDDDQEVIAMMKLVSSDMSSTLFNGANVDVHLCNNTFKTLRVVIP